MNEERKKTPINTMRAYELNDRLTSILQQAYHRRSRQLPANLNDIVETLKGDLLKAYPDVPIEVVDDAIVLDTLHNPDAQLSPVFFFNAVKKAWFTPKVNRHAWDDDENRRPDTEHDTISLLDTCAAMVKKMDAAEANGQPVAKVGELHGVRIPLPAFNSRREYAYLVMRQQLDPSSLGHHLTQAIQDVNAERLASHHPRIAKEGAATDPNVQAQCKRLAVLDWLRACNTSNTTPSAILTPLAEELSYFELRRTI